MSDHVGIQAELGALLSPGASIVLPSDPEFAGLTARWREYEAPNITFVVKVAAETDVQQTVSTQTPVSFEFNLQFDYLQISQVRYADKHDIPFVARAGGHGATKALSQAKNAIQIDFRSLNHITLSGDGQSATIGGGANVKDAINTLASLGKRTGEFASRL